MFIFEVIADYILFFPGALIVHLFRYRTWPTLQDLYDERNRLPNFIVSALFWTACLVLINMIWFTGAKGI